MLGGAIHRTATLASFVLMVAMAAAMPTVTIIVMAMAMAMAIEAEHGCLGFRLLSSALACIGPIKPIASRLSLLLRHCRHPLS